MWDVENLTVLINNVNELTIERVIEDQTFILKDSKRTSYMREKGSDQKCYVKDIIPPMKEK